ncbi:stemmadenine O-acetyltransferase-like [Lycium ferocissimum]|uniref:stemmadenine O-acetyltransferase-like n=1 Tax=Lycium ferocissimum TaxID=112874 RepID=UPI002814FE7F|nr:stemmadenine O-acetyltransferase-like [Lycium ferocissimum]
MKVEIEVVSKETLIKPCTPTPDKLRHYSLSYLDQIVPPVFMPLVYFYPTSDRFSNTECSDKIKLSLSEALTKFYPLAGRVVNNLYVDCNDEGVPYVEVVVKCKLVDIISDPIPNELNKFIPYELDDVKNLGLVVQVNFFECGGMAIGIGISHKLADAASCFMFINTWAAIARRDYDGTCHSPFFSPRFDSATLFPPKDASLVQDAYLEIHQENIVTKRFVFSNSDISALRDEYADQNRMKGSVFERTGRRPSRILALSAFLWSRFMATVHPVKDPNKIYAVTHSVNLRTRADPPLPESLFGNIMRSALVLPFFDKGGEDEVFQFMNQVRESMLDINSDFVSQLQKNDIKHLNLLQERANEKKKGHMVLLCFSSLCTFPLYEADFGWGKPMWVGSGRLATKNIIGFMDTKSGDGVEAWVNLKVEDMAKFEVDKAC